MGRPFLEFLDGDGTSRVYYCRLCHRTIADTSAVMSKDFHSKYGPAYLLHSTINVSLGPAEDRMMTSGMHTVCDIFCTGCLFNLGWKYLVAHEAGQKYKEGRFILERAKIADDAEVEVEVANRKSAALARELRTTTFHASDHNTISFPPFPPAGLTRSLGGSDNSNFPQLPSVVHASLRSSDNGAFSFAQFSTVAAASVRSSDNSAFSFSHFPSVPSSLRSSDNSGFSFPPLLSGPASLRTSDVSSSSSGGGGDDGSGSGSGGSSATGAMTTTTNSLTGSAAAGLLPPGTHDRSTLQVLLLREDHQRLFV